MANAEQRDKAGSFFFLSFLMSHSIGLILCAIISRIVSVGFASTKLVETYSNIIKYYSLESLFFKDDEEEAHEICYILSDPAR